MVTHTHTRASALTHTHTLHTLMHQDPFCSGDICIIPSLALGRLNVRFSKSSELSILRAWLVGAGFSFDLIDWHTGFQGHLFLSPSQTFIHTQAESHASRHGQAAAAAASKTCSL